MSRVVLILRPEPGASETAARARALGLEPVIAPLFTIAPLPWDPPDPGDFDALFLTSANAARCAGPALGLFTPLPCWAVGDATAAAARAAGFGDVRTGPGDGAALAEAAARAGVRRALHLHGRDHAPLTGPGLRIESRIVYASEAVNALPEAAGAPGDAVAMIHSPRAGALFASLAARKSGIVIAAISAAAAAAAGGGWAGIAVSGAPRDEALLELAVKLCKNEDARKGHSRRAGAGGADGL
ncbi:MAG: uroporphyrinogen synthase [Alphaproteobacteria bacterium]|nr:uroporphyrinogen synthase [Alphaproteobacteria bacterium]